MLFGFRCLLMAIVFGLFLPAASAQADPGAEPGTGGAITAETAVFEIVLDASWSQQSHPHPDGTAAFPSNPHFSPLIGATHQASVVFWEPGGLASAGIKQMAETGGVSQLSIEIQNAITAGSANVRLLGPGIGRSPGSAQLSRVVADARFPQLTLVTMIAPSPDWFVGVHNLSLVDVDGKWRERLVIPLDPYDAGTDSGADYQVPNQETVPRGLISSLRNHAPFADAPVATLTISRLHLAFLPYLSSE